MFTNITPEQAGISSKSVEKFIRKLEDRGLYSHGLLMMRGDDIFCECYWQPWNKDSIHRMYSQTKSFVGIAICMLAQEGKLSLDDKICDHFPEYPVDAQKQYLRELTVRSMLMMETVGGGPSWFDDKTVLDRTAHYFATNSNRRPQGMTWLYDSPGSQVLCHLVEKLSGMTMLEYMKQRLFHKMGFFRTAKMLKTRNDVSFGDSAMLCTLRDISAFARLLMNKGCWNGEQLISREYVEKATSRLVDNDITGFDNDLYAHGYGYQIWKTPYNGFAFVGMGQQLTIAIPEKNFLFSYISDNQGFVSARTRILCALEDFILDELRDEPLPEDPEAFASLQQSVTGKKLKHISGNTDAPYADTLNGVRYLCQENPTGITEFTFRFADDHTGELHYKNAQGDKVLHFGLGKNVFGKFPQYGYSGLHAGVDTTDGSLYDCAASAAWREDRKLVLKVQIIDKYLGNMFAIFSFRDDIACVKMVRYAEDFLKEYTGFFNAKADK